MESSDYGMLKELYMKCYRQTFRTAKRREGETSQELVTRLNDLVEKWTGKCNTMAEVRDLIVMEQLVKTMSEDIGIFVAERQQWMTYHLARRGRTGTRTGMRTITCLRCGKLEHIANVVLHQHDH